MKIRFGDFTMVTRSHSLATPIDATQAVAAVAVALFDSVDLAKGVRLLGVSVSGFGRPDQGVQLSLDLGPPGPEATRGRSPTRLPAREPAGHPGDDGDVEQLQRSWGPVTAAVDAIRERYGGSSVGSASLVGPDGLKDSQAWRGPMGSRRAHHRTNSVVRDWVPCNMVLVSVQCSRSVWSEVQVTTDHTDSGAGHLNGGCAMMDGNNTAGHEHGWRGRSVAAL